MTPKQADALIKTGAPVTLRTAAGETFTAVIVRRDRWNVHTKAGAVLDRGELEIVATPATEIEQADAAEEMADKIERIGQFIADNAAAIVARTGAGHYNALAVIENLASWIAAETAPAEFWHGDTDKAAAQVTPIAAALVAIIGADAAAKAWRLAGQE